VALPIDPDFRQPPPRAARAQSTANAVQGFAQIDAAATIELGGRDQRLRGPPLGIGPADPFCLPCHLTALHDQPPWTNPLSSGF
jgi:hypothetical protein